MAIEYTGKSIHLAVLARDDGTIADHNFTDCDIHGPAVLVTDGGSINSCRLTGPIDRLVWRLAPEQEGVVGAILLKNCNFTGCRFEHVGFAPSPEKADKFAQELGA